MIIFELNRKHDLDAERFIDDFKFGNLAMSLSSIINILDPDAFVFGGGVSNEIDFLEILIHWLKKYVIGKEYQEVFLKNMEMQVALEGCKTWKKRD